MPSPETDGTTLLRPKFPSSSKKKNCSTPIILGNSRSLTSYLSDSSMLSRPRLPFPFSSFWSSYIWSWRLSMHVKCIYCIMYPVHLSPKLNFYHELYSSILPPPLDSFSVYDSSPSILHRIIISPISLLPFRLPRSTSPTTTYRMNMVVPRLDPGSRQL